MVSAPSKLLAALRRRWPLITGVALGAFGLSILYLLITGLTTPDLVPATHDAKIVVTGISGQGLREGHTSWRFSAKKSEFSIDGATQTYHDAAATYYLRGKPTYKIIATEVTLDSRTGNYTADKGVRVWSVGLPEKQHFWTQALLWNNGTQTLVCPGDTDLLYHGLAIKTNHLSANLLTGMVTFGHSTAKVEGAPTPPSTIRSL